MMTALVLTCWGEIPVGGDYAAEELALQQFAVGLMIALGTDVWCLGIGVAIHFFKKED
jgi:hypothetical protein